MMADCEWIEIEGPSKYQEILAKMESIVEKVISGELKDAIIITEHEDVITKGTGAKEESDIISKSEMQVITTGRGGKLTYHGHGQRVVYPIIDLSNHPWNRDLKKYLNFLHQWIILTLKEFGIESFQRPDHIGVWVKNKDTHHLNSRAVCKQDAKIAAIGIRARKWVSYHGFAINITTDLNKYNGFVPCGIRDLGVTSAKELGYDFTFKEFDEILKKSYYTILESYTKLK